MLRSEDCPWYLLTMQTNHTPQTPVWHGGPHNEKEFARIKRWIDNNINLYGDEPDNDEKGLIPNSEIFKFEEKKD